MGLEEIGKGRFGENYALAKLRRYLQKLKNNQMLRVLLHHNSTISENLILKNLLKVWFLWRADQDLNLEPTD